MAFQITYRERTFRYGTTDGDGEWTSYPLDSYDDRDYARRVATEAARGLGFPDTVALDSKTDFLCHSGALVSLPNVREESYGTWWRQRVVEVTPVIPGAVS